MSGVIGNQRTAAGNMFNSQNQAVGNYLGNYSNAINSQETQPAMWSRLAQETGYVPLMQQATNLNNQLAYIPQQSMASTKGFDVNNTQLGNIMNMQQWKLAPLAQRATAQAQTAANIMGQQIAATQAQQQKELLPYQAEQGFLTDYLARQTSAFSQENQAELAALTAKMQTGAQLSSAEQDRMNQLKIAEEGYKNAIAQAQIGAATQKYTANLPYVTGIYPAGTQYAGPTFGVTS